MEPEKLAEKLCKEKACKIQYCLQANNYQESACQAEIAELKACCRKLSPEVLKHSAFCGGIEKKTETRGH